MRTLKKVLALSLALAMALSFMSFAAYTDADKFDKKCTGSIELLGKLGIMKGDTTGFRPTDTLTRGEAAKIVYTVLMGADDGAASYKSMQVFKDVPAALWSAGYINYLSDLGIVGGVGNGNFNPEGKVTGSELAKMLLGLLGYDAEILEFSGAKWETNVKKAAGQAGLNADYNLLMSAPAQRQWVAKMVKNSLDASMGTTTKLAGFVAATPDKKTLKVEKFGMKSFTGVITTIAPNSNVNKYTFTATNDKAETVTFPNGAEYGIKYFGHKVAVDYRDGADGVEEIYSVEDKATLVKTFTTTDGWNNTKTGDFTAVVADKTPYSTDYATANVSAGNINTIGKDLQITLISNTSAKAVDYVINSTPYIDVVYNVVDKDGKVQSINSLGGKAYSVSYADGKYTGNVAGYENLTTEKGGQPVLVTKIGAAKPNYVFTMLDVVSGTVTSKIDNSTIKFSNGNSYKAGSPATTKIGAYSPFDIADFNFKDTVNLYLNAAGKVVAVKGAVATSTTYDYAYIAATRQQGGSGYEGATRYFAYVVFANGTQGEYEINNYYADANDVDDKAETLFNLHSTAIAKGAVYGVILKSNGKIDVYTDAAYDFKTKDTMTNSAAVAISSNNIWVKNGVAKLATGKYATSDTVYFIVSGDGAVKPGNEKFSVKAVTGYNAVATLAGGDVIVKTEKDAASKAVTVLVTGATTGTTVLAEDVYYYDNANTVTETADGKTISYDLYKNGVKEVYTVNSKTVYDTDSNDKTSAAGFVRKTDTGLVEVTGDGYLKGVSATSKYENLLVLSDTKEIIMPTDAVIVDLTEKSTFDGTLENHQVWVDAVNNDVVTTFTIEYKPAAATAGFTGTAVTVYVTNRTLTPVA